MTGKAPLEGDRIGPADRAPSSAVLPDFIAPADKPFFVTPRWNVSVYMGDVLVCVLGWISAADEVTAIRYARCHGFTEAVRYEVTRVEEG